jgi:hypothetical protein
LSTSKCVEPYAAADENDTVVTSGGSSGSDSSSSSSNKVAELCKLLAFADAVGSTRGIILACLASFSVDSMTLTLQLAEQTSQLRMSRALYYQQCSTNSSTENEVYLLAGKWSNTVVTLHDDLTKQQMGVLHEQLAVQLEQLLYLAHKLQLPILQQQALRFHHHHQITRSSHSINALRFIHAHTTPAFKQYKQIPLLTAEQLRRLLFSDRVAAAAGAAGPATNAAGSSAVAQQRGSAAAAAAAACTAGRDAWVRSQLQQHLCITSAGAAQLPMEHGTVALKMIGQQQQQLAIKVELQQDLLEYIRKQMWWGLSCACLAMVASAA